jgi:hypothetical protein
MSSLRRQVLLGLGLATLRPTAGTAAIEVGDVAGVRVAGVLVQAGAAASDVLIEWGTAGGAFAGDASDPGALSDVYARVGGPFTFYTSARTMLRINAAHVVGDNLWLWRADHTVAGEVYGGANSINPCEVSVS